MKKYKKNIIKEKDYVNKMFNYCLLQEIKDSEGWIKIIKNHIKIYEMEKNNLMNKSFFGFLSKETKDKINVIDDRIHNEYIKLEDEISMIINLQDSLLSDNQSEI